MLPNSNLTEDLPRLAAEAFELSRHRRGVCRDADEVDALTQAAGLGIKDRFEIETKLARPMLSFVSKVDRRRYVAIAKPAGAAGRAMTRTTSSHTR
jgi:hypothetical protein